MSPLRKPAVRAREAVLPSCLFGLSSLADGRLSALKCSPFRRQPTLGGEAGLRADPRGGNAPKISARANIVGGLCAKRTERMNARIAPENRCSLNDRAGS